MKYNRNIDEERIQQAKSRTMNSVLNQIQAKNTRRSIFSKARFKLVLSTMSFVFMIVIGIVIFSKPNQPIPIGPSLVELSQTDKQKLAEVSYLSGNIIVNSLGDSIQQLALIETSTKFKDKAEEFDYYFQMIRPLMEDEISAIEIIELVDEYYEYRMLYQINNEDYIFDLSMTGNKITGIISFKDLILNVTGEMEVDQQSIEIELVARSGNNYIKLDYESEVEIDEREKEYKIEEFINGKLIKREINISHEEDEISVELKEIIDGKENVFELTKELEDNQVIYELEYEIDGVKGEGYISERIVKGKIIYRYHIEEDGFEEDYDFDEDDEEDEDDDDEEDEDE